MTALAAFVASAVLGCPPAPPAPPPVRQIVRPRWLPGTLITEYWPAPERWFTGRLVHAAGMPGRHRGWVNRSGARTRPCERAPGYWTNRRPFWLHAPGRAQFAPGHSRTLAYWRSAAVDRRLIAFGSRIFVPAYCSTPARGWLTARDTGGAIIGAHIDVYRPPPARRPSTRRWGTLLRGQKIFVVPPGTTPRHRPDCP